MTYWSLVHGDRVVQAGRRATATGRYSLVVTNTDDPGATITRKTLYRTPEACARAAAALKRLMLAYGWRPLPLV